MNDLINLFSDVLTIDLIDVVISGARGGDVKKIKLRPVLLKKGCLGFPDDKICGQ